MGSACAFLDNFRANLRSVSAFLGPFWDHIGLPWSHLGAILGHHRAILKPFWASKGLGKRRKTREDQRRANSAKIARRLGESSIFDVPGSPVEAFLGQVWGILGSSCPLGANLMPSSGFLERSWGHLGAPLAQLGASWGQLGRRVVPKWRPYWFLQGFCWLYAQNTACAHVRARFQRSHHMPSTPAFTPASPRLLPGFSPASPRLLPLGA